MTNRHDALARSVAVT